MIKTESFRALFLVFYCPLAGIAMTLLYFWGSYEYVKAALWGSALSIVLTWITVIGINRLFESSARGLLILVFGGLLLRFFTVIAAGLYVNFKTDLHLISFFFGLLFSYFILQIIEIIYIQKRFGKRKIDQT